MSNATIPVNHHDAQSHYGGETTEPLPNQKTPEISKADQDYEAAIEARPLCQCSLSSLPHPHQHWIVLTCQHIVD